MRIVFLALALVVPATSFASYSVTCGEGYSERTGKFKNETIAVSSESSDFTGVVGKAWKLRLHGKPFKSGALKAKATETEGEPGSLRVVIEQGHGASGPVGTEYLIQGPHGDRPALEVYTMGGFVGHRRTATAECRSSTD